MTGKWVVSFTQRKLRIFLVNHQIPAHIYFVLCSLNRTLALPKILSLDYKNKYTFILYCARLIVHWLCRRYFRSTIKINVHLFCIVLT